MFKLNISNKGKAWKLESEAESLIGKSIGEKLDGKEISSDLAGYELEITGTSDIAGFPGKKSIEGPELKRVLLTKGWGMHKKPRKEGKKKVSTPKGLRLRKTVRGNTISDKTVQINLNVLKEGTKKLPEIFPDQNKKAEEAPKEEVSNEKSDSGEQSISDDKNNEQAPKELQDDNSKESTEEKVAEEIAEEVKEEIKDDIPSSPETSTEEKKEEAAEKIAEEVKEEIEDTAEKIAEDEEKE